VPTFNHITRGGGVSLALGTGLLVGLAMAAAVAAAGDAAPDSPGLTARPSHPRRIVSATLSTDEILLALVPPSRLLAVTAFARDPGVSNAVGPARAVRHVVDTNPERLLALEPDVVFADPVGRQETFALLGRVGVPVVRVPACESLADIERNVRWVGEMVDRRDAAERLVARMETRVAEVRRRVRGTRPPRVLLFNRGGYTSGAGTLFDELLTLAGGRNAAAEGGIEGHASLPIERALALDADVVLVTRYRADARAQSLLEPPALVDDPTWQGARAVRERHVHVLDGRHVLSTSHHAAHAVEDIARVLHPERFP